LGKRIRVQRRGKGSPVFRAASHKRVGEASYPPLSDVQASSSVAGLVEEIVHEPGRGAPLGRVRLDNGESFYTVPPEGVSRGQQVQVGAEAPVAIGNVLPLGRIPAGAIICNVELTPGDGGRVARSSGAYATVITHTPRGAIVKLPSGRNVTLSDRCRATVGVVSGAGRPEKPFLRAGKRAYLMTAKGRKYPWTRGVAMIAAVHPHGGGRHKTSLKPTTVSRRAPPGAKVGLIAARRSGFGKRRRKVA